MIAYLNGKITINTPTYVVVECGNVGYLVNISLHTYSQIQDKQQHLIHIYYHVSENAHTLYGFAEELEKNLFIQLISVSGIGPSTARMALSSLAPVEIQKAILSGDVKTVQSIKGIGPKSAQRIILELRDKVAKTASGETLLMPKGNTFKEEALSALLALGFARAAAEKAIDQAADTGDSTGVEGLIKKALKLL
jgi:Holliday junction DNA helicase RuvA